MKKDLLVFISVTVFLAVLVASCKTPKEEQAEIPCGTILDCPPGMNCVDFVCVELSNDNNPIDKDSIKPDTPDNEIEAEETDEFFLPTDYSETSDIEQNDDQMIADEDDMMEDENDSDLFNDITKYEEIPSFDDDELLVEEIADQDTNNDTMIADEQTDELLPDNANDEAKNDEDEIMNDEDTLLPDSDAPAIESVTIGDGTETQWIPIGCRYFKYSRSASLYLASEIGYSANIKKLGWYDENGAPTSRPIKIYLKETSNTALNQTTWASMISGATLVFDAPITTTTGWNDFTLSTPFAYTGNGNLLVLVEMNKGAFCSSDSPANRYTSATGRHAAWNSDSIPTGNGTVDGSRPNIKIGF